ncbi:acyl-CoA dehydrogenase family protein [Paraburkholderia sacchari]|uniref:Acyl-CoA dehydrogenase n=1 Tax=Paraburkholderia sacchari TaxID=159450 RepID=A0A8T6Z7H3_9BURK|nr:acyl-CoA dehydrogenase [Paraburkholderia sacchari]NLP60678.1 acyl-CoA dehydrogenase [Paraburkholderia sacchari]
MDFSYTDEQRQLADTLRRYAENEYTVEHRRKVAREHDGLCRAAWRTYAEFGLLALTVPEAYGGFSGSAADIFVVQYEAGRALLLEPLIPSSVVSAGMIAAHGSESFKARWLPALADGSKIVTPAWQERNARFDFDRPQTIASALGDGYRIDGGKLHVWHGGAADAFIVPAWNPAVEAVTLFMVDAHAQGVSVRAYPTVDGQRAAEVTFESVIVAASDVLGDPRKGAVILEAGLDSGIAALCAASVGAIDQLIGTTAEYLRTRRQFGQPLAAFQALRHRLADMQVQKELALSMTHLAVAAIDASTPAERRRAISGAKAMVARAARFIGQNAIQLHGGIGVTAELVVGDYFKFLTAAGQMFGDADHHTDRFARTVAEDCGSAPAFAG